MFCFAMMQYPKKQMTLKADGGQHRADYSVEVFE
jgi:hypothetical protein